MATSWGSTARGEHMFHTMDRRVFQDMKRYLYLSYLLCHGKIGHKGRLRNSIYFFEGWNVLHFRPLPTLHFSAAVQCSALHQTLGRLRSGPWGDLGSHPFEGRLLDWLLNWVNLSKRGGKDGVFQGLAGLLRGISRGAALPARESPILPDSFTKIYILFSTCFFKLLRSAGEWAFFNAFSAHF